MGRSVLTIEGVLNTEAEYCTKVLTGALSPLPQAILEAGCLEALGETLQDCQDMPSSVKAEMCAAMAVLASEGKLGRERQVREG